MIPVGFFVGTDLVVIDHNPEMADIDHPRGEIIGYAAYVYAEAEDGERRRFCTGVSRWETEVLGEAEKMAAALTVRLASGRYPVAFDRWEDAHPCYGSKAYQRS